MAHYADVIGKAFRDTTEWQKPRTLADLPDFLEHFFTASAQAPSMTSAPKQKGSPHTIVVTGAGLRAADLTRSVSPILIVSTTADNT